ncbi:MAG: YfiR family protein [Marinobacter sp.]|uniref:YfiR family protein n=1 Tax=Marinobacter sp. TaxID=50741 RepID=UPI00299DE4C0|nr:YfiR family protein [Marinobacter sp.]MDX1755629.1 YfiR family protein [Marinobacter sp.]
MNQEPATLAGIASRRIALSRGQAASKRRLRSAAWALAVGLLVGVVPVLSAQDRASESQVRAFILLRLAGQIYWSPESDLNNRNTPYRLCIYRNREFMRQMRSFLGNQDVTGKPVELIAADNLEALGQCHVAYLGDVSEREIDRIVSAGLLERTVFVGSSRNSASAGLHIRLYLGPSDTFDIEINRSAFAAGGNEPSAAFVKLAGKVYGSMDDVNGGRP